MSTDDMLEEARQMVLDAVREHGCECDEPDIRLRDTGETDEAGKPHLIANVIHVTWCRMAGPPYEAPPVDHAPVDDHDVEFYFVDDDNPTLDGLRTMDGRGFDDFTTAECETYYFRVLEIVEFGEDEDVPPE